MTLQCLTPSQYGNSNTQRRAQRCYETRPESLGQYCGDHILHGLAVGMHYSSGESKAQSSYSTACGDWMNAPSLTPVGLRLSDEAVRVTVGLRFGSTLCHPHTCICDTQVDTRGLHGLSCRKSGPRHIRAERPGHSQLNASEKPKYLQPRNRSAYLERMGRGRTARRTSLEHAANRLHGTSPFRIPTLSLTLQKQRRTQAQQQQRQQSTNQQNKPAI